MEGYCKFPHQCEFKSQRIAELEAALRLALEFWHSDHPNDTYEGADAHEKIVAALGEKP